MLTEQERERLALDGDQKLRWHLFSRHEVLWAFKINPIFLVEEHAWSHSRDKRAGVEDHDHNGEPVRLMPTRVR